MKDWFASEDSPGPKCVADFFPADDEEAKEMRATRAFGVVATFLDALG